MYYLDIIEAKFKQINIYCIDSFFLDRGVPLWRTYASGVNYNTRGVTVVAYSQLQNLEASIAFDEVKVRIPPPPTPHPSTHLFIP